MDTPVWGFGVRTPTTYFEIRGLPGERYGLFTSTGEAVLHNGRVVSANSVEGVRLLATEAKKIDPTAISRVVRSTGTDINGPFTRLDIGGGEHALETTLRGTELTVDWVSGPHAIFNLGEIQRAAGGAGSIRTVTGYVTDQLAVNIQQAGYLRRLEELVSARLGGRWTSRTEVRGNKTYLIFEPAR